MSFIPLSGGRPVNIACSTYAFHGLPLVQAFERIRDLGFSWAEVVIHGSSEWSNLAPSFVKAEPSAARDLLRTAQATGRLRISSINLSIDENEVAKRGQLEAVCRLARDLEVPVITIPAGWRNEDHEFFRLKDYLDVAASVGIRLSVEPQMSSLFGRSRFLDLPTILAFAKRLPGWRLTLDTAHFISAGTSDADLAAMLPFVGHVHLRDARPGPGSNQVPFGKGGLRLGVLVEALRLVGYDGVLTIEYLGAQYREEAHDLVDAETEIVKVRRALEGTMSGVQLN